jgi:hypothetical protein
MEEQDYLYAPSEKLTEVSINNDKECVENKLLDITGMIRSIQRLEGNFDCFGRACGYCDQLDCCWRPYCLGNKPLFK